MDPAREIRFDGWTLLPATGELLRDRIRTRLQQQPLAVLLALLERPGELVTREELIRRLWPRGVVDFDTALNSAVRRLRTTLDDHAESPRYIETIPRRGYRFIGTLDRLPLETTGDVAPVELPSRSTSRARRLWLPLAAAVVVVVAVAADRWVESTVTGPQADPMVTAPVDAGAQDRFQLAQHLFQRRGPGDLDRARQQYEEALAAQPGFAEALAGLAGVYWIQTVEGLIDPQQGLSRVRDAAERALALDPALAEAHLRLSQYRAMVGDRTESEWHAKMAAALRPDDPLVLEFAASRAAAGGRLDEAIALQRRALELEPLSRVSRYNLAGFLLMAGQVEQAGEELRAIEDLGADASRPNEALAAVLMLEDRAHEALGLAKAWPAGRQRLQVLAITLRALDDRAGADRSLEDLVACCGAEDPLRVAEVYGAWGDGDAAFAWLDRGLEIAQGRPWESGPRREAWYTVYSPYLLSLHGDPRWAEWVAAVQARSSPDRMAFVK